MECDEMISLVASLAGIRVIMSDLDANWRWERGQMLHAPCTGVTAPSISAARTAAGYAALSTPSRTAGMQRQSRSVQWSDFHA